MADRFDITRNILENITRNGLYKNKKIVLIKQSKKRKMEEYFINRTLFLER